MTPQNKQQAVIDVMEALKIVPSYTYNKDQGLIIIPEVKDKVFLEIFNVCYNHNLRFTHINREVRIWLPK